MQKNNKSRCQKPMNFNTKFDHLRTWKQQRASLTGTHAHIKQEFHSHQDPYSDHQPVYVIDDDQQNNHIIFREDSLPSNITQGNPFMSERGWDEVRESAPHTYRQHVPLLPPPPRPPECILGLHDIYNIHNRRSLSYHLHEGRLDRDRMNRSTMQGRWDQDNNNLHSSRSNDLIKRSRSYSNLDASQSDDRKGESKGSRKNLSLRGHVDDANKLSGNDNTNRQRTRSISRTRQKVDDKTSSCSTSEHESRNAVHSEAIMTSNTQLAPTNKQGSDKEHVTKIEADKQIVKHTNVQSTKKTPKNSVPQVDVALMNTKSTPKHSTDSASHKDGEPKARHTMHLKTEATEKMHLHGSHDNNSSVVKCTTQTQSTVLGSESTLPQAGSAISKPVEAPTLPSPKNACNLGKLNKNSKSTMLHKGNKESSVDKPSETKDAADQKSELESARGTRNDHSERNSKNQIDVLPGACNKLNAKQLKLDPKLNAKKPLISNATHNDIQVNITSNKQKRKNKSNPKPVVKPPNGRNKGAKSTRKSKKKTKANTNSTTKKGAKPKQGQGNSRSARKKGSKSKQKQSNSTPNTEVKQGKTKEVKANSTPFTQSIAEKPIERVNQVEQTTEVRKADDSKTSFRNSASPAVQGPTKPPESNRSIHAGEDDTRSELSIGLPEVPVLRTSMVTPTSSLPTSGYCTPRTVTPNPIDRLSFGPLDTSNSAATPLSGASEAARELLEITSREDELRVQMQQMNDQAEHLQSIVSEGQKSLSRIRQNLQDLAKTEENLKKERISLLKTKLLNDEEKIMVENKSNEAQRKEETSNHGSVMEVVSVLGSDRSGVMSLSQSARDELLIKLMEELKSKSDHSHSSEKTGAADKGPIENSPSKRKAKDEASPACKKMKSECGEAVKQKKKTGKNSECGQISKKNKKSSKCDEIYTKKKSSKCDKISKKKKQPDTTSDCGEDLKKKKEISQFDAGQKKMKKNVKVSKRAELDKLEDTPSEKKIKLSREESDVTSDEPLKTSSTSFCQLLSNVLGKNAKVKEAQVANSETNKKLEDRSKVMKRGIRDGNASVNAKQNEASSSESDDDIPTSSVSKTRKLNISRKKDRITAKSTEGISSSVEDSVKSAVDDRSKFTSKSSSNGDNKNNSDLLKRRFSSSSMQYSSSSDDDDEENEPLTSKLRQAYSTDTMSVDSTKAKSKSSDPKTKKLVNSKDKSSSSTKKKGSGVLMQQTEIKKTSKKEKASFQMSDSDSLKSNGSHKKGKFKLKSKSQGQTKESTCEVLDRKPGSKKSKRKVVEDHITEKRSSLESKVSKKKKDLMKVNQRNKSQVSKCKKANSSSSESTGSSDSESVDSNIKQNGRIIPSITSSSDSEQTTEDTRKKSAATQATCTALKHRSADSDMVPAASPPVGTSIFGQSVSDVKPVVKSEPGLDGAHTRSKVPFHITQAEINEAILRSREEERNLVDQECVLMQHTAAITDMRLKANELYTCDATGTARIYNIKKSQLMRTIESPVSTSPSLRGLSCLWPTCKGDSGLVLYLAAKDRSFSCYDVETGACLQRTFLMSVVTCMIEGGNQLYLGLQNGHLLYFDLKAGLVRQTVTVTYRSITCLSPQGEGIQPTVLCGTADGTVVVIDHRNRKVLRTIRGFGVPLCMHVLSHRVYLGCDDHTIRCYNYLTGEAERVYTDQRCSISRVYVSNDSLVAACADGFIRSYKLDNEQFCQLYYGAGRDGIPVSALAVTDSMLYSASTSGTVEAVSFTPHSFHVCQFAGCSLVFGSKSHLIIHLLKVHVKGNNLKCQWTGCADSLSNLQEIKEHLSTHVEIGI